VAWVSEIKNTLSLPLFLLSCDAWLDAEEKKTSYLRSTFYYLAAMLAKTSTVMLPLVLLLYSWWKGGVTRQNLKRIIPYLVIAIALGLVTIRYQHINNPIELGGFVTRLTGAGAAVFFYLGKFILPIDLLPIYPGWILTPPSLLQVLSLPALACILFGLWLKRLAWGRHALLGFGFFLLNLLPVLGVVKMDYMVTSPVADHLVYLPMIGLVGLVAAGLEQLHQRHPFPTPLFNSGSAATVLVAGFLFWQSYTYARAFKSSEIFWTYTLERNPQSWAAHHNLGYDFLRRGQFSEAIEQFEQALKIYPGDAKVHDNLGAALQQTGRFSEAIEQYEQALKMNPRDAMVYYNLGTVLARIGRFSEAIEQFEQALKINPADAKVHHNLGVVLQQTGRFSEAIEQFDQALKLSIEHGE
jgi:tetratricopeptide (TPR) repeat protein